MSREGLSKLEKGESSRERSCVWELSAKGGQEGRLAKLEDNWDLYGVLEESSGSIARRYAGAFRVAKSKKGGEMEEKDRESVLEEGEKETNRHWGKRRRRAPHTRRPPPGGCSGDLGKGRTAGKKGKSDR